MTRFYDPSDQADLDSVELIGNCFSGFYAFNPRDQSSLSNLLRSYCT